MIRLLEQFIERVKEIRWYEWTILGLVGFTLAAFFILMLLVKLLIMFILEIMILMA